MASALALVLLSYLLGAVPFGLILTTLLTDVDIRGEGSGNIGATNVLRTTGRGLGAATLALDLLKGLVPVLLARTVGDDEVWLGAVGLAAVIGHCWPVYLEFKGGKGVATAAGVLLALAPAPTAGAFLVWGAVFGLSRRSSLAAIAALVAIQGLVLWVEPRQIGITAILGIVVLFRHRDNMRRLLAGDERPV